jgi:phosphate:Na+ symporter
MLFNLELFKIYTQYIRENSNYAQIQKENKFFIKTVEEKYDFLKQLQGALQVFYLKLSPKLES